VANHMTSVIACKRAYKELFLSFAFGVGILGIASHLEASDQPAVPRAAERTENHTSALAHSRSQPSKGPAETNQSSQFEPRYYRAVVRAKRAFDRSNFTQGLEFHDGRLLVSSGLYGQSVIRSYRWPDLSLEQEQALPKEWFAEGLTLFDNRLYVLTWRARLLLAFDYPTLTPVGSSAFPTEGWGLTHAQNRLYWSDGSSTIYSVNAIEGGKVEHLNVTLNGKPVPRLNELEWIKGELWANVWQTDTIVRIDPNSGLVVGVIDLKGLLADSERAPNTDVLNGIAYDADNDDVWVTGKRWPWLYKIGLERQ